MNINDVISSINSSLVTIGSKLGNFTKYSNTYALVRAVAETFISQQTLINSFESKLYIKTAVGTDLDVKLEDLGIKRLKGTFAKGWCLVTSNSNSTIPQGTILTDSLKTYQFKTNSTINVSGVEIAIPITSTSVGASSNIESGVSLYNPLFPNFTFVTGRYRDPLTNSAIVSVSGGSDNESDEAYRIRANSILFNTNYANSSAVYNSIASVVGNTKFYLVEQKPVTGIFSVYIDSSDSSLINKVQEAVELSKPLGTAYLIQTITKEPTDVVVSLSISAQTDSSSVLSQARSIINTYFNNLGVGQEVVALDIEKLVTSITGVRTATISIGSNYVLITSPNSLASIGNLSFSIKVI